MPPHDDELRARRLAAWGALPEAAEQAWEDEVLSRLVGGLVVRTARDGSRRLWRADALALEYYAHGGLPASEHLASPSAASAAGAWQPLLVHRTMLAEPFEQPSGTHKNVRGRREEKRSARESRVAHASFSSLLLLASECALSPLKSDVTQHALLMPVLAQQLLWFMRAANLQRAIGVSFADSQLLRRAFVHPTYGDKPEVLSPQVGRALSRMGTLEAQRRRGLREALRSRGLRRLIHRMDRLPLPKDAVMCACVEAHNQRLEFLGDSVIEFVATHHLFTLLPNEDEGELTEARTGVVNNKLLAAFAARLGLHTFLLIAERAPVSGVLWADEPEAYDKVLADTFEALAGALYLDRGLTAVRNLVAQCLFPGRADVPLRRLWLQSVREAYVPPDPRERDEESDEHAPFLQFEASTGLRFAHFGLLIQAFTHPSYYQPRQGYTVPSIAPGQKFLPHNQRLEFLGDAVLQLLSADYLFHCFPEHQEDHLSSLRNAMVNNALICDVAATCGMHHCMRFFTDTMIEQGRARRSMLADCFEAFLGALYLDRQPLGLGFCKAFVTTSLFDLTQRTVSERRWMDPKMRLQFCLHEFNATARPPQPLVKRFCLLDNFGPSHERMYVAGCYINDTLVATARGQSFTDAQMGAALEAAKELGLDDDEEAAREEEDAT